MLSSQMELCVAAELSTRGVGNSWFGRWQRLTLRYKGDPVRAHAIVRNCRKHRCSSSAPCPGAQEAQATARAGCRGWHGLSTLGCCPMLGSVPWVCVSPAEDTEQSHCFLLKPCPTLPPAPV